MVKLEFSKVGRQKTHLRYVVPCNLTVLSHVGHIHVDTLVLNSTSLPSLKLK